MPEIAFIEKDLVYFKPDKLRFLNIFYGGFILYIIGAAFSDVQFINSKFFTLAQLFGLGLTILGMVNLIQFKIKNAYLKILLALYFIWVIILLFRGFGELFDKQFLLYFLLVPEYGGLLYFLPLVILLPKDVIFYKKTFNVIVLAGIFYLLFDFLFLKDLLSSDRSSIRSQGLVEKSFDLGICSCFLLLTFSYHSNKKKLFALLVILLTLFFAVVRARRGLILMTSTIVIISFALYFFTTSKKIIVLYLSVLIGTMLAVVTSYYMYKIEDSEIFGFVIERGKEDSRTNVELYFYDDMKLNDLIIGRGINGEYFCPDIQEELPTNYRSVIETGYLQIILKGGIIHLGLLLLIAVPAMILGLFYSKNTLSKAASLWILFALVSLYPATVVTFSLRYLLVWISIGICYSKSIRKIPEKDLKEFFLKSG